MRAVDGIDNFQVIECNIINIEYLSMSKLSMIFFLSCGQHKIVLFNTEISLISASINSCST